MSNVPEGERPVLRSLQDLTAEAVAGAAAAQAGKEGASGAADPQPEASTEPAPLVTCKGYKVVKGVVTTNRCGQRFGLNEAGYCSSHPDQDPNYQPAPPVADPAPQGAGEAAGSSVTAGLEPAATGNEAGEPAAEAGVAGGTGADSSSDAHAAEAMEWLQREVLDRRISVPDPGFVYRPEYTLYDGREEPMVRYESLVDGDDPITMTKEAFDRVLAEGKDLRPVSWPLLKQMAFALGQFDGCLMKDPSTGSELNSENYLKGVAWKLLLGQESLDAIPFRQPKTVRVPTVVSREVHVPPPVRRPVRTDDDAEEAQDRAEAETRRKPEEAKRSAASSSRAEPPRPQPPQPSRERVEERLAEVSGQGGLPPRPVQKDGETLQEFRARQYAWRELRRALGLVPSKPEAVSRSHDPERGNHMQEGRITAAGLADELQVQPRRVLDIIGQPGTNPSITLTTDEADEVRDKVAVEKLAQQQASEAEDARIAQTKVIPAVSVEVKPKSESSAAELAAARLAEPDPEVSVAAFATPTVVPLGAQEDFDDERFFADMAALAVSSTEVQARLDAMATSQESPGTSG